MSSDAPEPESLSPAQAIQPYRARLGLPLPEAGDVDGDNDGDDDGDGDVDGDDDSDWPDVVAQLGELFDRSDESDAAQRCAFVASAPDNADFIYNLAFKLYELGLFDIGAGLLARANRLEPNSPKILSELSSCLEAIGRNAEAAELLAASPLALEADPMLLYLLGFNQMLSGQVEPARESVDRLLPRSAELGPRMASLPQALVGMLARADALSAIGELGPESLRSWQAVINGDLLLHLSPYGFDAGMRGRYAFVGDSPALMAAGLAAIESLFAAGLSQPQSVLALAEPSSRAMALAASKKLNLPLLDFSKNTESPGLICVYDIDALQDPQLWGLLQICRPGQRLWLHGSSWTNPFPFAADFTGILYQARSHAFKPLSVTAEAVADSKPMPSAEEQAEQILAAAVDDEARGLDYEKLLPIAQALAALDEAEAPNFRRTQGARLRNREGSPVKSNRFL